VGALRFQSVGRIYRVGEELFPESYEGGNLGTQLIANPSIT